MATVIERERTTDRPAYVDRGDSGAGWAVALVLIVAVLAVGLFVWARYRGVSPATPNTGGSNINVTVPGTSGGASGGASGSAGGTVGY